MEPAWRGDVRLATTGMRDMGQKFAKKLMTRRLARRVMRRRITAIRRKDG
jgi:hypothetical protein